MGNEDYGSIDLDFIELLREYEQYRDDDGRARLRGDEMEAVWGSALRRINTDLSNVLFSFIERCRSPVEEMFLAALLGVSGWGPRNVLLMSDESGLGGWLMAPEEQQHIAVEPQAHVGAYRVDFLISLHWQSLKTSVIIEVDGHEFHEKTKAQVEKDKKRERAIVSRGIPVLRFSGTEVFKDAEKCANETMRLLSNAMSDLSTARSKS